LNNFYKWLFFCLLLALTLIDNGMVVVLLLKSVDIKLASLFSVSPRYLTVGFKSLGNLSNFRGSGVE